ncbi:tRNA lysidine(34) synthetase TilS [Clostridium saccharobutylicum]|uniref:tRNA(Ile)-lysidine synthase n=1 Tax=Clostridium saccharobutylicum DSM 13864 TaxID=1345695 RepID=U5MK56_CLOSA|nr:tRNA lysidine(34) synthetase TilS [Clostridium saccharobutylicum]AGX41199.1 tRNA(Ile)-lysidine synthase TilS [Clostridium saccharobutylicum DSM 13864]AQR88485.1 tRNA(Ile)-lysidine synthase [Clostridium saccharobutylicum]AQR98383.1 tRNA(Ile)-lysidine synthase [Clostridium saccharobutylicum]AQS08094.1 tRNA(Ile)-lysidine synthase [Clostridium saccharobutylicum]AQS12373.1 tRNA(Ile)-lysidine synthase [Clostridium saccharobutylicum]
MYKKVLSYIKDNNLIEFGDKVLVAVSGGPDSICLLNILFKLKEELNIDIGVAHLNHMLRGEDAFGDEEYVINTCEKMNIPCFVKRMDIETYSKEQKLSCEMAGRNARYDFFDEIMKKEGYSKVATAHNANDQAETILFRLMRGTGLEGLGGIKASRDNKIVRPILCLSRKEVEDYIQVNNLNPRIDKTNFEKIYNRNKIRLDILPYMKKNFNDDIIQTLNRMSILIQKDNQFIEKIALSFYNKYCIESKDYFIIKKEMFEEDEVVINRVLRNAITKYSKSNYDFEMKHIYEILQLSKKNSGKIIDLPNKIYAENIYGDIYIKHRKEKNFNSNEKKQEINIDKGNVNNNTIDFNDFKIEFLVIENYNNTKLNLEKNNFIKYFDLDQIIKNISVRNRKDGDKIIPLGMSGSKKLKDIFIDMKIPKEDRDNVPILCFDDKIAWIVGLKVSEQFKITNKTKNILKVVIQRKEY